MSSHDVRKLRPCVVCKDLGLKNEMIRNSDGWHHGKCYITKYGLKALLNLPTESVAGLTLGDIGTSVMRKLMDKHYPAKKAKHK